MLASSIIHFIAPAIPEPSSKGNVYKSHYNPQMGVQLQQTEGLGASLRKHSYHSEEEYYFALDIASFGMSLKQHICTLFGNKLLW